MSDPKQSAAMYGIWYMIVENRSLKCSSPSPEAGAKIMIYGAKKVSKKPQRELNFVRENKA